MAVLSPTAPTNTSRRDILTDLWCLLTSGRWLALLLVLLALTMALFALWPYVAPVSPVPVAYSTPGLKAQSEQPGQAVRPLPEAGTLDIYRLYWLRTLLGVLAFTLVLRLVDRLEATLAFRRHWASGRALYLAALPSAEMTWSGILTIEDIRRKLRHRPPARLSHIWEEGGEDRSVIIADRLRVTAWADIALHLGGLLCIAGLIVASHWSWREDGVTLAARESYRVRNLPGYTLAMESTGGSGQGDSQLTLAQSGGPAQAIQLAAARPYLRPDIALSRVEEGPALRLSVADRNGDPLLLQSFIMGQQPETTVVLKFHGVQDDGYLSVPALGLTVRVDRYQSLPEEGYDVPVYLLRAYRGTQPAPLFSQYVTQDGAYDWQGLSFHMRLEDYAILNIAALYHWWFLAGGLLLVVIGLVLRRWPSPWLAHFETVPCVGADGSVTEIVVWGARAKSAQTVAAAVANLFGQEDAPAVEAAP